MFQCWYTHVQQSDQHSFISNINFGKGDRPYFRRTLFTCRPPAAVLPQIPPHLALFGKKKNSCFILSWKKKVTLLLLGQTRLLMAFWVSMTVLFRQITWHDSLEVKSGLKLMIVRRLLCSILFTMLIVFKRKRCSFWTVYRCFFLLLEIFRYYE